MLILTIFLLLKIFWPNDNAWYKGKLTSFDEQNGRHLVLYDDGESEILDLAKEKVIPIIAAKLAYFLL